MAQIGQLKRNGTKLRKNSKSASSLLHVPAQEAAALAARKEAVIQAADSTVASKPRRSAPLQRQLTGIGTAPSHSRSNLFATETVEIDCDEEDLAVADPRITTRKARVAKQRAERPKRPEKDRGAHAHAPLRTEMEPSLPAISQRTADAADSCTRGGAVAKVKDG